MTTLGILKTAGALGLLVGIGVPVIGMAAAIGLVLFFVAAIIVHLRAHDYTFGLAVVFLLLAVASLVLGLHTRRPMFFGAPHKVRSAGSSRLIRNEV